MVWSHSDEEAGWRGERLAQQVKKEDLTYSDPKIKRTTGL